MKCDKVLPQLSDYIDELLTTEDKSLLEEHMKQCNSCANELQKLSKTVALVRSLPKMSAPINLQKEISQAITPMPWLKIYKSLSLAAGLLLSFVLGMWFVIFQNPDRFMGESAVAKSQDVPQKTTPKIQKQNEVKVRLPRKEKESPEFFNAQRDLTQKKRSQSPKKSQIVGANKNNTAATKAEKDEKKDEEKEITKFTRPSDMGRENSNSGDTVTKNEASEIDEMDDFAEDIAVEDAAVDMDHAAGGSATQLEAPIEKSPTSTENAQEMKDSASAEMSDDPVIEATQGADTSAVQTQEGNAFADDNYQSLPPSQNTKSKNDKRLFGEEQRKTVQRVKRRDRQTQTTCNKCHVEAIEVMHEQLVAKISLKTLHESLSACNKCHIILDEEIIRKGHIIPRTTITSIVDDQNGSIAEQIFVVQKMIQLEYALRGLAKAKTEGRLAKYARQKIAVTISTLRKSEYAYHEKYIKPALVKVVTARLRIGNRDLENVADFVREQARSITLLPIEDLNNLEKMPLEEVTEDEDLKK